MRRNLLSRAEVRVDCGISAGGAQNLNIDCSVAGALLLVEVSFRPFNKRVGALGILRRGSRHGEGG